MREYIKRLWGKVKWILFLIIWTLGTIGWCYFYQEFSVIRKEATWAYAESVKLHQQSVRPGSDIKDKNTDAEDDVSLASANDSQVAPNVERVEDKISTPTTGIEELIKKTWNNEAEAKIAIAVAKAESHLNPESIGDKHLKFFKDGKEYGASYGIFQIRHLEGRPDPSKLLDSEFNVKYAYELYCKSGFSPWSTYKSGKYLAYIQ